MIQLLALSSRNRISSLALALAVSFAGCSGDRGPAGNSCTVETDADAGERVISCSDGTRAVVSSKMSSTPCSVTADSHGTKTIKCEDGTSVVVGDGENGKDGKDGAKGTNGDDGTNGSDRPQGANGADGGPGRSSLVVGAGLVVEILDVVIPKDRRPVASVRIRDAAGHALDRTATYTPDPVSVSFVLSYLSSTDGVVGQYVPYNTASVTGQTVDSVAPVLESATQPRSENNGTWTEVDTSQGTYTYRFANALPSGYDGSKTHTLAAYATRTTAGAQYASDPIFNFRPDGEAVTETREIVTTAACNGCHNPLAEHGGGRREIGLCITCHVEGTADPESGNALDMKQMIHKIHRGHKLATLTAPGLLRPVTPLKIVGFMNSVHDYSDVVFPQATENCATCHQGADADRWKTGFSRAACGSCHDEISFANPLPPGKVLHRGGVQTTDTLCVNCHGEGMGPVANLQTDVVKVHRVAQKFDLTSTTDGAFISAAPVITGSVVSVTGTGAAEFPVITFEIKVNDVGYDILAGGQALDRLRFTFAGPTTDYVNYVQYNAQGAPVTGALAMVTPGVFTWTSAKTMSEISLAPTLAVPAGPAIPLTGSWAVGMEGRLKRDASLPSNARTSVSYFMHNAVFYFAVTDIAAVARRTPVVVDNCNSCHSELQAHGGSRNDPEYCVLCHNANKDTTNIPAPAVGMTKLTTSLRLSHMIHRIHTGAEGNNAFLVGSNDFSEVLFPGDRRDCTHCHIADHYKLPLPPLLPSHFTQIDSNKARVASTDAYMGATGAACTGCHDDDQTAVHVATQALVNSGDPTKIQEACTTCHATGQAYGIDIVHARLGL